MARIETLMQEAQLAQQLSEQEARASIQKTLAEAKAKQARSVAKLKDQLIQAAAKGAGGGQQEGSEAAEEVLRGVQEIQPPRNARQMQGVPTGVDPAAIADQLISSPGSAAGGGAVQAGGGGVQIPGLGDIPSHLTTRQRETGVQFVRAGPVLMPIETTTSRTTTQPNALRPRDVLQAQLQQQQFNTENERADRQLKVGTQLQLLKTYGGTVAGAAEALVSGDYESFDKLTRGKKTTEDKVADAAIAASNARASYWKAKLETVPVFDPKNPFNLDFTVRTGLDPISSATLGTKKPITDAQLMSREAAAIDSESGLVKEGQGAAFSKLQKENLNRGVFMFRGKDIPNAIDKMGKGKVEAVPLANVVTTVMKALGGSDKAYSELQFGKYKFYSVAPGPEGREQLEPSSHWDPHTKLILEAIVTDAEMRFQMLQEQGISLPPDAPIPPPKKSYFWETILSHAKEMKSGLVDEPLDIATRRPTELVTKGAEAVFGPGGLLAEGIRSLKSGGTRPEDYSPYGGAEFPEGFTEDDLIIQFLRGLFKEEEK